MDAHSRDPLARSDAIRLLLRIVASRLYGPPPEVER